MSTNFKIFQLYFSFFHKKIDNPLKKETTQIIVQGLINSIHWKKINYNQNTIKKAIQRTIDNNAYFWDEVIIETMIENNVNTILTEDTKHFKDKQINAINPFKTK